MGQSINRFLELHAALIRRLARQVARHPLQADDVAQDVIASLLRWSREGAFEPERVENPEAYLRVAVRNRASQEAKRAHAESPSLHADAPELIDDLSRAGTDPAYQANFADQALEARALLERLKAALSPRDALAFALLVEDGLNLEQVASALGTTMNNVYQIQHRIRSRARQLLDAAGDRV